MSAYDPTEIPHSKKKLLKLLFYCLLFLVGGIWMLGSDAQSGNALLNNPVVKNSVAVLAIIMAVVGIYLFTKKMFDKAPGLVLDSQGITDNTSAYRFGLIPWSDIVEVHRRSVSASLFFKQYFITLVLRNPQDYINRVASPIKRKLVQTNAKHYGSPVHISTNALQTNDQALMELINQYLEKYKPA